MFELAGHFDISIGLTWMLIANPTDGQLGRDRVSFFIFPRSEVAPVVYDYAYTMVEGKKPQDMPGVLRETFRRSVSGARTNPPTLVGSGYYALMELGEFVPSRVVEAVVHGFDLTDALGRDTIASPEALAITAGIMDELLARRTVAGRPSDLVRRPRVGPGRLGSSPARRPTATPDRLALAHAVDARPGIRPRSA